MITDLIGTNVTYNDDAGKIRAVYQDHGEVLFGILLESGRFVFDIKSDSILLNEARIYAVHMVWKPEQKIRAIKAYRMINEVGLKEAKDTVEAQMHSTLLKDNLTLDEANVIVENLRITDPLDYIVRKMPSRS